MSLQPAVKKETVNVVIYTSIGTVLMFIVLFILHMIMPKEVPFDYTVILGGLCGALVGVANFFLMAVTVQNVAAADSDEKAQKIMKASYSRRMLLQLLWIVAALLAPVFYWIAGIAPLLMPSAGIKIKGIIDQRKFNRQEVERKQDGH